MSIILFINHLSHHLRCTTAFFSCYCLSGPTKNMPGDNCSIFGCPVSRSSKYKGIGIYKVPSGDSDFEKTWREKLIAIIVRDRVVDATLKERIAKKKLFICQKHYRPD